MKILTTDGFFATNIGNAFFMLGAQYFLKKAIPEVELYSMGDLSANRWNIHRRPPKNDFNYIKYVDVDYIVTTGPCLTKRFALYNDLFNNIFQRKKTKIILLSVGGSTYDEKERDVCRRVLSKYPPFMLFTRDEITYSYYSDLAKTSYNGLCTAFFINDYFKGIPTPYLDTYITMTFDNIVEPLVKLKGNWKNQHQHLNEDVIEITFKENKINSGILEKIKNYSSFIWKPLIENEGPDYLGPYNIIRPTHCSSHRYARELFIKRNTYVSEVPDGYLNLYKNTSLNLTDRVHSAVASLVWGRPTRLFTQSKRAALLAKVGAVSATKKIIRLDMERLAEEKEKMLLAFRKAFERG